MKKIDKHRAKDYAPLILWAEDLSDLLTVLTDCEDPKIVADDVEYDSLEEFLKDVKGRRPLYFALKTSKPYVSVELNPRWARLYASSSQTIASGVFLKLDSILSRCERKPRILLKYGVVMTAWIASPLLVWFPPLKPLAYLEPWLMAVVIPWGLYASYVHIWKFSLIRPIFHHESPSFFKRNFDGIVIALISAFVGAILGAAALKFSDRMWPTSSDKGAAQTKP